MKQPGSGGRFPMRRRVLCLYLPQWPIQRLRGEREGQKSEIRGPRSEIDSSRFQVQSSKLEDRRRQLFMLSVVLHARDPRRGDVVVVCDAAAFERGVRVGMPLAEAAALAEHGGECLILPHDPAADLAGLARLPEWCERFSPIVGWRTADSSKFKVQSSKFDNRTSLTLNLELGTWNSVGPDCLFLDVTGIGVLFGGEEELEREVVAELAGLGYGARVAIADTIGAAWAGAKYGRRTKDENEGSFVLSALRLPAETVDLLSQLGIERVEQMLALPRESLRARFGELLLLRIDQLLGTAQEVIVPYRPPPQFSEEWL